MTRRSLALSDMLGWFSRVDRLDCEALLVGCELEADEDAESGAVTSIEWGSEPVPLAIDLAGGRRVPFRKVVREASFTDPRPGSPLLRAFEAARTPTECAADEDRGVLAAARIREEWLRSAADRQALAGFLREIGQRRLPAAAARHAAYLAFRSGEVELARIGAQLMRRLVGLYERECEPVPEDCHWRLAVLLRQAGAAREALAVSDVLEGRKLRDRDARKLLSTTRCGAALDLWRASGDREALAVAERAFKEARALGRDDDEVKSLGRAMNAARMQRA